MSVLVEVCVDTTEGLAEAIRCGAGRIELCSALDIGGLTPSVGMMQRAAGAGVPIYAMIRPRPGHFVWSPDEISLMETDIEAAYRAGMQGVVLGASQPDGRLDSDVLGLLIARASNMGLTLNRCFDLVPDFSQALEQAIELGFHRVLTSGGERTAAEGADRLASLMEQARGRITIMPGAGITAETLAPFRGLPLRDVHASCSVPVLASGRVVDFGFAARVGRRTDGVRLRDLRAALADILTR
ncbi:MAG: copper homeostasis protein CutC [Pseudotabrizicola sp.]|uniref:copper homeostasis protein CutC n=1 Tax=Pseudotabrizicola sp. TaxID=2939647 RepID=UPI002727D9F1|nr:copper homeostasis protein CutC [Pseudotabrizicola sp.]MDO8882180.1 copper homeostasis protein CutC [Pseudotabrizicola sp.]MDP2083269.1 copper homeostasis protein CutC [Pseudotabrizicola sp.]MDZ7575928.1 copper homeostasis protein CutC [Pseudotabrizicola sp.]